MIVKILILMVLATIGTVTTACGSSNQDSDNAVVAVVTTNNIIQDWVQHVGGIRVEVFSLVPSGADPHSFQPGAREITRVADADVVFIIGLGLEERWLRNLLDTASSDSGAVVALGNATDPITIGDQSNDIQDPHFWFDPIRVKLATAEIALTLIALDPEGAQEYRDNAIAYLAELDELHAWSRGMLDRVPQALRVLVTSHDTLGYFAERYDFKVVGTLISGLSTAEQTSAKDLVELVNIINAQEVSAIFVENTTSDRLANRLAEEAGVSIVSRLHTGSLNTDNPDANTYLRMMRTNVTTIVEALR